MCIRDRGAANDPLRTLAEGAADDIKGIGVGAGPRNIVFTPGVTDLTAEIDAGPGKGRGRWWRRRKVGRES